MDQELFTCIEDYPFKCRELRVEELLQSSPPLYDQWVYMVLSLIMIYGFIKLGTLLAWVFRRNDYDT